MLQYSIPDAVSNYFDTCKMPPRHFITCPPSKYPYFISVFSKLLRAHQFKFAGNDYDIFNIIIIMVVINTILLSGSNLIDKVTLTHGLNVI